MRTGFDRFAVDVFLERCGDDDKRVRVRTSGSLDSLSPSTRVAPLSEILRA